MRHPTHTKETIACRRFERAVHEDVILQRIEQGNDYGIDYYANGFDAAGKPARRFNVQVKHLSPDDVLWLPKLKNCGTLGQDCNIVDVDRMSAARHTLSLSHVDRYLNPSFSSDPTLYVLANQQDLFCFWINDAFDYCLRWQPLENRQTTTWYVASITLADRVLEFDGGHELVRPFEPEFSNATAIWTLVSRNVGDRYLGTWCQPKTPESLSNIGLSAYITCVQNNGRDLANFDVPGYWAYLQEDARERPWIFLPLGLFLGLLKPTREMSAWARATIERFSSQFDIPAAFRILAAEESSGASAFGKKAIRARLEGSDFWRDYDRIEDREHDWQRLTSEYFSALAHFLFAYAENGDEEAQELLFDLFGKHDPSLHVANTFGLRLQALAREKHLLPGESLDTVLRWIKLDHSAEPDVIVKGIADFISRDAHDYRFNK